MQRYLLHAGDAHSTSHGSMNSARKKIKPNDTIIIHIYRYLIDNNINYYRVKQCRGHTSVCILLLLLCRYT